MSEEPEIPVGEKPTERSVADPDLVAFYLTFRRCGGTPSLSEWSKLTLHQIRALVDASLLYEAELGQRAALQITEVRRDEVLDQAARDLISKGG